MGLDERLHTVLDALRLHAASRPDQQAAAFLIDETRHVSWTYRELDLRAQAIAAALLRMGCAGRTALLIHPPGLEFIAALYGCFYAGVVAVPAYPPSSRIHSRSDERLATLVDDAKPSIGLTTESALAKARWWTARSGGDGRLKWCATDSLELCGDPGSFEHGPEPDSLALLQYTSGSTRTPKGVMLTHRNLIENQRVIVAQFDHSPSSHMVSWLPPYHDMGLIGGLMQPLTVGFALTAMPPLHVLQKPLRWLQAMSRFRATTTGAPNSMYDLCLRTVRPEERDRLDLSAWTVAYNGSEPVRAETIARFSEFFAPCGFRPGAFLPCYGLAESTLLVAGRSAQPRIEGFGRGALERNRVRLEPDGAPFVSCGEPGPDYEVAIVDPDTRTELKSDHIGEVWLSGPCVSRGYWNRAEETADTFQNELPGRDGRFMRTGDLGVLLNGELFVTGRIKDLVIVRGRNFFPHEIEHCAAASHPALSVDACVAFSTDEDQREQLVVACEVRRAARHTMNVAEIVATIRRAVVDEFGLGISSVLLLKPGSLPRTTSGKLRRNECRQMFDVGAWQDSRHIEEAAPSVTELSSLASRVRNALSVVLRVPGDWLDDGMPLASLGLDSLMQVEFLLRLESETGLSLDLDIIQAESTSLKDLIRVIEQRGTEPRGGSRQSSPAKVQKGERVPLLPIQHEFLSQFSEEPKKYAIVLHVRTPHGAEPQRIKSALDAIERRHDAFQLRFRRDASEWVQEIGAVGSGIAFRTIDAREVGGSELRTLAERLNSEIACDFDLSRGPIGQAVFLDRGDRESGVLFLSLHHLIVDGIAITRLIFDLEQAYRTGDAFSSEVTFAEWARCLEAHAQSKEIQGDLGYWQDVCRSVTKQQPLVPGPGNGALIRFDSAQSRRFLDRWATSQEQHDVFLGALAQAWAEVTDRSDLFVRLESHGRFPIGDKNPMRTMGRFVFHFPVRLGPGDDVAAVMRKVPHGGLSFGALRYLCRHTETSQAMQSLPVPQVGLTYRGRMDDTFRSDRQFPVMASAIVDGLGGNSGFEPPLSLHAGLDGGGVCWRLVSKATTFPAAFIGRLETALRSAVSTA